MRPFLIMSRFRLITAAPIALLALTALLVTSTPAGGAPSGVAERREAAQAARAEMARLGEELTPAIERYNEAVSELADIEANIAFNRRQIDITRGNLRVTEAELNRRLDQTYRVGTPDLLTAVFAQASITEILAVDDLFTRARSESAELVEGLREDRATLARRQRTLAAAQQRAELLRETRAAEQRAIEAGIARQQALAVGLEDEIAQLIAEDRARQERLRRQALAAIAAQGAATASGGGEIGDGAGDDAADAAIDLGGSADLGAEAAAVEAIDLPPTDGSIGAQAVSVAMQYLGVPYVWGGASPSGFDCSGLTQYAYAQVGVGLTHFTGSQWNEGVRVPADQLLPGDLVFYRPDLGHMGMYIGGGQYIHAPQTGDVVKISSMSSRSDYQGAVRPY